MGSTHAAARQRIAEQTASSSIREAERRRTETEQQLAISERLLGTQEQVSGQLGAPSEAEVPYLGRYSLDTNAASILDPFGSGNLGGGQTIFTRNLATANNLLDQAQQAARAGNSELAAQLKAQAEAALLKDHGASKADVLATYNLNEDPDALARSRLDSPLARTTGEIVRQGREFLDPNSTTSKNFKFSIIAPGIQASELGEQAATRAIDASERSALRRGRDLGMMRGAGRNPLAERAIDANVRRQFASEEAQVRVQAAADRARILGEGLRFFEVFSREFSMNSVQMGQAFLQNQSGVREQFQGAVDQLKLSAAEFASRAADRAQQDRRAAEAEEASRKAFQREALGAAAGLVVGIASFGVGFALGGLPGGIAASNVASGALGSGRNADLRG